MIVSCTIASECLSYDCIVQLPHKHIVSDYFSPRDFCLCPDKCRQKGGEGGKKKPPKHFLIVGMSLKSVFQGRGIPTCLGQANLICYFNSMDQSTAYIKVSVKIGTCLSETQYNKIVFQTSKWPQHIGFNDLIDFITSTLQFQLSSVLGKRNHTNLEVWIMSRYLTNKTSMAATRFFATYI